MYKNKSEIVSSLLSDIKAYIKQLSSKYSVNREYFVPWLNSVKERICSTVNNTRLHCKRTESIFTKFKDDIDTLKDHFILTGVDKAPKNISIICKQYYIDTMKNELVNTNTYSEVDTNEDEIIRSHVKFCAKF